MRRIPVGDRRLTTTCGSSKRNVTHPRAGDLIFHPPAGLLDASPEQIVHETLRYHPIAL
ncbi:hypothetical protein ACFRDV_41905 [Streptomyces fagopyri]|uniref:hypothetical protein n=1 Tax=Streptomyces fagopyri TaxID=2662397 RepID=UPI003699BC3C